MHTLSADFQNATPVYDRKAIMVEAHASVKRLRKVGFSDPYAKLLADRLRYVWGQVKAAAAKASLTETEAQIADIKAQIADLPNKSFRVDIASEEKRLLQEIAKLEGEGDTDPTPPTIETKRDLINAAGGRFCSVVFIKKDGTERTMNVQPAKLKFHCKGADASESAQKATATRKARHPHLMPVWDAGNAAPRSVNLLTVTQITVDGTTHQFAAAA